MTDDEALPPKIHQKIPNKRTNKARIRTIKPFTMEEFFVFLALLVISQFLWVWFSSPLRNALDQLVNNMDSVQSVVKKINNSEVIVILSKFEKLNGRSNIH